ncbi:MAG: MarR family transcriptional regulator [Myxococcota bacterium]
MSTCRRLYGVIDQLDHEAATVAGVSRNDLRALNALEGGPVRAGALASTLGLTSGSVSTLIDRLERRGLAQRVRDTTDRRAVLVAPTPKLFELLGPLYRRVALQLEEVADRYDEADLGLALRHLDDVIAAYRAALSPRS